MQKWRGKIRQRERYAEIKLGDGRVFSTPGNEIQ